VRDLAVAGHDVASARDIAALAARGDASVGSAVRQAGRRIGEVLAGAVNLLNPDVIVVWGYLADGGDHLVAGLREGLYRGAVPAASRHVSIEAARYGDDAALRGAATAVLDEALLPSRIDALVSHLA
jgi:predicted NBD/HSP70 family sugar kinase